MKPLLDRPGCVFLSYHRGAPDVARWVERVLEPLLLERLPHAGVTGSLAVFRDETSIPPGVEWPAALRDGLRDAAVMASVLTPEYFTRPWCLAEFHTMLARQHRTGHTCVLPLRYSDGDYFLPEAAALERVDIEPFNRVRTHRVAPSGLVTAIDRLCVRIRHCAETAPADPAWQFVVPRPSPEKFLAKALFAEVP